MKKKLLFCFFSIGFALLTQAQQLQFSTWTRVDTYLINDTVFQHFNENTCSNSTSEGLLVSSTYTEEGNVFTVQDVTGPLACSNSIVGTYTFTIINGTILYFTLVSDACTGRANSLTEGAFYRMPPKTIHIPADFPGIQQGIVAADNYDTVLVAEGSYFEQLHFFGKKPIMVASEFLLDGDTAHIANTIINGSQSPDPARGSVVTFDSGEDTSSVLCGFTITGGSGTIIPETTFKGGGGVFITNSGGKLLNNYIEYNVVSSDQDAFGAGILLGGPIEPIPWVVLRNNRIRHNQVLCPGWAAGGGIESYYSLIMAGNQISNNEVNGSLGADGGGLRINGGVHGHIDLDLKNNSISHNKSISNNSSTEIAIGGGVDIFGDCSGKVIDNSISFNKIEVANNIWSYGTGAMVEEIPDSNFAFENNIITNNTSSGGYCVGGGLCIWQTYGRFRNNVVQNNTATHGGGIGMGYNSDKLAVLINNTISENNANDLGGGLYAYSANAVIVNSIIWGNTAPTEASIYHQASTLEVRYSDVEGDDVWPGEGNVNCHASFLSDGYHLSDSCQLVEAGIASIEINGIWYNCPAYDIDGEGRPSNAFPEIGADEVLIVSVPEPAPVNNIAFNIYPNPAYGKITLELNEATSGIMGEVSIIGITGKELLRQQVTGPKTEFNVSNLAAGLYFIRLIPNDQNAAVKTGKFVKH